MNPCVVVAWLVALGQTVIPSRGAGGYLKWMFEAKDGYFPYDTSYAPAIMRGISPGDERVAVLSKNSKNNWVVNGLNIVTGKKEWDAVLPYNQPNQIGQGVLSGNPYQFVQNSLNLVMLTVPGVLITLDGENGTPGWQWPIPVNNTLMDVSGWDTKLGLLLQGEPVVSPYFPTITRPTILAAIDATDGHLLWIQNATTVLPLSQAEKATYAVETIAATKDGLLYSRGNKITLINWNNNGSVLWQTMVSLEGSVGRGQGANVTNMFYIPQNPLSDLPDRILLNANNWGFQRFIVLQMNMTNISAIPEVLWRSRFPETSLLDVDMTAPVADNSPESEMFYYWANRTTWRFNEDPISETYLVGKKLSDGSEVWSSRFEPIDLPAVDHGRVFVTSTTGLKAIQGSSGSVLWSIDGDPSPKYSYLVSPTFANETGQMVAVRCMQSDIPTMCMYSAFEPHESASISINPWTGCVFVCMIIALHWSNDNKL